MIILITIKLKTYKYSIGTTNNFKNKVGIFLCSKAKRKKIWQVSKYFEEFMIPRIDCTTVHSFATEVLSAIVEAFHLMLSPNPHIQSNF